MDEIGVDIKSTWSFNDKGDLELASDKENIIQAVTNRFNAWLGTFDAYYLDYGSVLSNYLGWKRNDETLGFMKIEIENTLNQDPRLPSYDLSLDFNDTGGVDIRLDFGFDDDDLELNLVISEDGRVSIIDDTVVEDVE